MFCLTDINKYCSSQSSDYTFLYFFFLKCYFCAFHILIYNPYGIDFCVECKVGIKIYIFPLWNKGICLDFNWYCIKSMDEFRENGYFYHTIDSNPLQILSEEITEISNTPQPAL